MDREMSWNHWTTFRNTLMTVHYERDKLRTRELHYTILKTMVSLAKVRNRMPEVPK